MNSPQQQIFGRILTLVSEYMLSREYGSEGEANVYDYLPGEEVTYPFVFVGEQFDNDLPNKTAIFGEVTQTIHVYHDNYRQRGELSSIINDIRVILRSIKTTKNFYWHVIDLNGEVIPDNSTNVPLLHGVIEVTYRFN